jgi:flavodoxin
MTLGDRCDHIVALIDEVLDATPIAAVLDARPKDDMLICSPVAYDSRPEAGPNRSAIIVCCSRAHGNTAKVAHAIAEVLDAQVVEPPDIDPQNIADYDLVGFGSGIYAASYDRELRRFVASLPRVRDKFAFVFATAGFGRVVELPIRTPLPKLVESAGYRMLGTFCCPGFDTWLPLRLIGGLNKGRPNDQDLERACQFARGMRDTVARQRDIGGKMRAKVGDEVVVDAPHTGDRQRKGHCCITAAQDLPGRRETPDG